MNRKARYLPILFWNFSMTVKLVHGVKNGKIVRIAEVENGLSCGCICPNIQCGARLVAVQGKEVAWHFRHYSESYYGQEYECAGAAETAIHLLAKDILAENKKQILPARVLTLRRHNFDEIKREHKKFRPYIAQNQMSVTFDEIKSENDYSTYIDTNESSIKPDAIAVKDGIEMYFEIRVTHAVDVIKREKIKNLGKSCIEIDLSHANKNIDIDIDTLKKEVLNPKNRKWICHRKDNEFLQKAVAAEEAKGKVYRQKRLEEDKKRLELEKAKREQDEKNRNNANYKKFRDDLFDILSNNYPWSGSFIDERIQKFMHSEDIDDGISTILNKYDVNASMDWHYGDEAGIEWEIHFCGETFYSSSSYDHSEHRQESLFNFIKNLLPQDAIQEANLRETKNREEKEKRRIEWEELQKKLDREKQLREQEEKDRKKAEIEEHKRESERIAVMRKDAEKRERQKHEEIKKKFLDSYTQIRSHKAIRQPWNTDVTPSEIKAKCGFDDTIFVLIRKELQAEKKLKAVPENCLLTAKL
ncbi:MAG: hypothetical protein ACKN9T_10690 [Candidatus Methylumidiphilus sp.]